MNGHIVIRAAGKAYRRFSSRRHKWLEVLSLGWFSRHTEQWVLREVDMEVQPGESVGLIGYNGAGKSTLLKLVAGVLAPTVGRVESSGRVAAILELGVGFHMELTGRQNIPLAGQLMGYTASELTSSTGDIMAFAELGDMIDQPLRAYSSGMLARLAFSIATAVRPDILIVDEALSVGDAFFQHKSFARIRAYKEAGTTTLFVSHDFSAIRALCDRVVLFNGGRLIMDAQPQVVLDYYNALIAQREAQAGIERPAIEQSPAGEAGLSITRSGTGEVSLSSVRILDAQGHPTLRFSTGDLAIIDLQMRVNRPVESLVAGIMIRDRAGNPIYGTNTWHLRQPLLRLAASTDAHARFSLPLHLGSGSYSLTVALTDRDTHLSHNFDWQDNLFVFEVTNASQPPFVGVAFLPTVVNVARDVQARDLHGDASAPEAVVHTSCADMVDRIVDTIGADGQTIVVLGPREASAIDIDLSAQRGWHVHALESGVSPDNIEPWLAEHGLNTSFDVLAINLHGNDYWVWQALHEWQPRVVVIGCNGAYPPPRRWVMAPADDFVWREDTYYGASPQSLCDLAKQKGYELVCCDEQGQHLFFVQQALYDQLAAALAIPDNRISTLFRPPRYGEPENGWTYPRRDGPSVEI
ncbi:MAG: ABC transporter ATP-binding protein [Pseudomonadota bacterium]